MYLFEFISKINKVTVLILCLLLISCATNIEKNAEEKIETNEKSFAEMRAKDGFFTVKPTRIVDGDTLDITHYGYPIRVRLYGIDTPEKKQAYGMEATEKLEQLLEINKEVTLELINIDGFGRSVAIIHLENGKTVQEELLISGSAWYYSRYCKKEICAEWEKIQDTARENKNGLWQKKNPTAPWNFRKK